MADNTVPVSGELFTRYGVSTTPTLVFINRDGTVRLYHPGQMTKEQIEPVIKASSRPPDPRAEKKRNHEDTKEHEEHEAKLDPRPKTQDTEASTET